MGDLGQAIIGIIIGILIFFCVIVIVLGARHLLKAKISIKYLLKKWQFWVSIVALLSIVGTIIPDPNKEIIGTVLYIHREGLSNNRNWYQMKASDEFEKIKGHIPDGITSVCVWYKTDFIDARGKENEDTIYRIGLSPEDIEDINWNNFSPENIELFEDGGFYAWQGLEE